MRLSQAICAIYIFSFLYLLPSITEGHASLLRAEPAVGSIVRESPPSIRIWFDGQLKPAACVIHVQNEKGDRVDRNDSRVNPTNPGLLEVSLTLLPSGQYKVIWHVTTLDGHRIEGDYIFIVEGDE